MSLWPLARRALFTLEPETAHHLAFGALEIAEGLPALLRLERARVHADRPALATTVAGVRWPNALGLAAGLDKNALAPGAFFALGFGAVEVGTVTPRPQPGNPTPRLFRVPEHQALLNRMGFNNGGAAAMADRLQGVHFRPGPLGINLGKNKDTPNERAAHDYAVLARRLGPLADYLVVNLSSPNTPGLRALQAPEALAEILRSVTRETTTPVLLKIAPDLEPEAIDAAVDVALSCGLGGLIATNTTLARPFAHPLAAEAGGLSGAPLEERATQVVRRCFQRAKGRLSVVGVGGIGTPSAVLRKVRAGASAVQIYSALIFQGPGLVKQLLDGVEAELRRLGVERLESLVGTDAA